GPPRRAAFERSHPQRQPVGVLLLRPDWLPRPARPGRAGDLQHHAADGRPRPLRDPARANAGADRPVLALCRYRVDLPVPLALPGLIDEAGVPVSPESIPWQTYLIRTRTPARW